MSKIPFEKIPNKIRRYGKTYDLVLRVYFIKKADAQKEAKKRDKSHKEYCRTRGTMHIIHQTKSIVVPFRFTNFRDMNVKPGAPVYFVYERKI